MSSPAEFQKVRLSWEDAERAMEAMEIIAGKDWRETRGAASWAGLAAEDALIGAYDGQGTSAMRHADTRAYDLEIVSPHNTGSPITIEVKTRAVDSGWTDPRLYEWITVPTHDGREPIKDVAYVFFCWYSMDEPEAVWVLGYVRGPEEFKRRAQFYREGQPLPRGGWAPKGGAWCIEVKQLRPLPRDMFREIE